MPQPSDSRRYLTLVTPENVETLARMRPTAEKFRVEGDELFRRKVDAGISVLEENLPAYHDRVLFYFGGYTLIQVPELPESWRMQLNFIERRLFIDDRGLGYEDPNCMKELAALDVHETEHIKRIYEGLEIFRDVVDGSDPKLQACALINIVKREETRREGEFEALSNQIYVMRRLGVKEPRIHLYEKELDAARLEKSATTDDVSSH